MLVNLRAAQGILRLEQPYGAVRLEVACTRALDAGSARYRTVKTILAKSLDQPLGARRDPAPPGDLHPRRPVLPRCPAPAPLRSGP